MHKILPVLLFLPLLAAPGAGVTAQAAEAPRVGERVRVTGGRHPGKFTFEGERDDTLIVRDTVRAKTYRVPLASITGLAVRRPHSWVFGALRGAGIGFVIGAATGAVLGISTNRNANAQNHDAFLALSTGDYGLAYGVLGGGVGLILGTLFGSAMPGHAWQRIPLSTHVTVAPRSNGGLVFSFSIPVADNFRRTGT